MADPGKICVPDGALRVEIDDPERLCIEKPAGVIRGWVASRGEEIPEFHFQIGGVTLPHLIESRRDVEEAMTEHVIVGFKIQYDLTDYLLHIQNSRFTIRMTLAGYDPFFFPFKIENGALAICLANAGGV
jgi:hypothetical protein